MTGFKSSQAVYECKDEIWHTIGTPRQELPLSVPVANAIGQLVTVRLRALEGGDFERRLAALEHAVQRPRIAGSSQ